MNNDNSHLENSKNEKKCPIDEHHKSSPLQAIYKNEDEKRWIVNDYELAKEIFKNSNTYCRNWENHASLGTWGSEVAPTFGRWGMFDLDGDEHRRLRTPVSKMFTPKKLSLIQPKIESIVDELIINAKEKNQIDFISDFSAPMTTLVMAELLGVSETDLEMFLTCSEDMVKVFSETANEDIYKKSTEAKDMLEKYFHKVIDEKRKNPQEDLISSLIRDADETLSKDEMVLTCIILITAGNLTTTDLLGNAIVALLKNPLELDKLRLDNTLYDQAIEEVLRYDSPATEVPRYTSKESNLKGHTVPKGETIAISLTATNNDPKIFSCPHQFDISREKHANNAFGGGVHYCVGAALSRFEAKIALKHFINAFSKITLIDDDPKKRTNVGFNGHQKILISCS